MPAAIPLPSEIWLHIVEYVIQDIALANILDLRLVSRTIQANIDTRILYSLLRRVELYYCFHCSMSRQRPHYLQCAKLFVNARFERVLVRDASQPIWNQRSAIFRLEKPWARYLNRDRGQGILTDRYFTDSLSKNLKEGTDSFGVVKWAVKIGDQAFDVGCFADEEFDIRFVNSGDLPYYHEKAYWDKEFVRQVLMEELLDQASDDYGESPSMIDLEKPVYIEITGWRYMLFACLKEARDLQGLLRERDDEPFSDSHVRACLMSMRRRSLHWRMRSVDEDTHGQMYERHPGSTVESQQNDELNETPSTIAGWAEKGAVDALMWLRKHDVYEAHCTKDVNEDDLQDWNASND